MSIGQHNGNMKNDKQRSTIQYTDRATQTLLKIEDETQVFRNVDTYKWKIHNGKI
jgi:hypothetical protein